MHILRTAYVATRNDLKDAASQKQTQGETGMSRKRRVLAKAATWMKMKPGDAADAGDIPHPWPYFNETFEVVGSDK